MVPEPGRRAADGRGVPEDREPLPPPRSAQALAAAVRTAHVARSRAAASSVQAIADSRQLLHDGRTLLVQSADRLARGAERERSRAALEQAIIDLEIRRPQPGAGPPAS
jgi:hypothetical protein